MIDLWQDRRDRWADRTGTSGRRKSRWWTDATYAYGDPDGTRRMAGWRQKLVHLRDGHKRFRWLVPGVPYSGRFLDGTEGTPAAAERCLYRLSGLQQALASPRLGGGVLLLTEGEKDANTGARLDGVVAATSHWGGACDMTPAQAQHLAPLATARGRRRGPRVLVVVDRDDAGYADGLHRLELLRALGVWARVVRPADGVVPVGRCGPGVVCECPETCPPPDRGWEKADLTDHVAAGYGLSALVPVPAGELRAGADRWAAERAAGADYGGPELDPADVPPAPLRAAAAASARAEGWSV